MRYKSEKGITLTTLVITVIVILIVSSSMIYSGVNTYKSMLKQNFLAEMQVIQAEVNKFVDAYKQKAENLGLPSTESFRRIYATVYEDTTNGYATMDAETRARYDEFYEFVNSYNSIEKNFKEDLEEIQFMDDVNTEKRYILPRLNSTKAAFLAERDGPVESKDEFEEHMDTIWLYVFNTDGAQFVNLTSLDEAAKEAKIDQDQENYFYFTREMASQFFNIEISTDITINFENGYVLSVSKNVENEDKTYHTEYNMQGGEKTVTYNAGVVENYKATHLDFSYNIEFEETNKRFKITIIPDEENTFAIKNIYYYLGAQASDETIDIGLNGQRVLNPGRPWNLVDGLTFYAAESSAYGVKLVDMNGNEAYRVITATFVNSPVTEGLTPIVHDGTSWREAEENEQWYNYEAGEWANATISDGDSSTEDSVYVWIPRFAYRILYFDSLTARNEYLDSNSITKIAGISNGNGLVTLNGKDGYSGGYGQFLEDGIAENYIVELKFLKDNTNMDSSGTDVTTAYGGYFKVHPAFQDGRTGFWISKYNLDIASGSLASNKKTAESTYDVLFRAGINVRIALKSYEIDTHMITGLEYGAMLMLTEGLMSGKGINSDESNTNNEYGIYELFDGRGIMTSSFDTDMYNSLNFNNIMNNNGQMTEEVNKKILSEVQSGKYFTIYSTGAGNPYYLQGDGICEFAYKPSSTSFAMKFLSSTEISLTSKPERKFFIIRGYNTSSEAPQNMKQVLYTQTTTTQACTKAVIVLD